MADHIVVGGGHNGLVAACYLARAGLSVLVLEQSAKLGGGSRTEELVPATGSTRIRPRITSSTPPASSRSSGYVGWRWTTGRWIRSPLRCTVMA